MNSRGGFSLVETLIYVAILAAVSIFIVNSILMITKSFNNYRAWRNVNAAGEAAMERMVREIKLADSINMGTSVFDSNPGHLALNTIDPDTEAATTIEFYVSGNALMIKEGVQSGAVLTPSSVELMNLIFREVATSTDTKSKAIRIEMEIRSGTGNYQKTARFYDTAILRRSY